MSRLVRSAPEEAPVVAADCHLTPGRRSPALVGTAMVAALGVAAMATAAVATATVATAVNQLINKRLGSF